MTPDNSPNGPNVFVTMYDKYVEALNLLDKLEADLVEAKALVKQIEQREFPALMQAHGMEEYTAHDGHRISLGDSVYASLKGDKLEAAMEWLAQNDLASIVKRKFTVLFNRNEDEKAAEFKALIGDGWDVSDEPSIHPQTLQANIRTLLSEGVEVPLDLLGATVVTEVSRKKPRKAR